MISLFHAGREVSGAPADAFRHLHTEFQRLADEEGFSKNEKKSLIPNKYGNRVALLSVGHLQYFFRTNEIVVSQSDIAGLCDYLDEVLPEQFDDPIIKPALPGSIEVLSEKKRALVIAQCDDLSTERNTIQNAISSFFGKHVSVPEGWPTKQLPTGYEIASTSHEWSDDVIDLAKIALERTPLFRDMYITYEPADITMVPIKES